VCQRCGSFVCSGCIEIRSEDVFCGACAALLDRPPSKLIRTTRWLSALWLLVLVGSFVVLLSKIRVFGVVLAATPFVTATLFAFWLVEWRAQRRGDAPPKGQVLLKVTAVFLAIESLISLLAVGALVYFLLAGVSA
jgi:hypothetical protein